MVVGVKVRACVLCMGGVDVWQLSASHHNQPRKVEVTRNQHPLHKPLGLVGLAWECFKLGE
jgi:hypothetical protein